MRWIYFDEHNPQEAAAHAATLRKIDEWWQAFVGKIKDLEDHFNCQSQWDLPAWMIHHLELISPELMWEFGPALSGDGHRLVITPETQKHLRPMVQTLLERAPQLPGWEFYPYRPPESVEMANLSVSARTGGELDGTMATAFVGEHNRIDVCYYSSATEGPDDEQARQNAFVASETLLGEEVLDRWVGCIDVQSLPRPRPKRFGRAHDSGPRLLPLDRLKPTVDALVASVIEQLPSKPVYAREDTDASTERPPEWVTVEMEPTAADDFACWEDLFVAVGMDEKLWRALHQDPAFYSERFSRHGERFCYLKVDGKEGLDEEKFPDRARIEDALDEVLVPARAGRIIGGGTGLRYSYIDLALANVETAIPLIMSRLRDGNITRRSWLLFFDAPLSQEWIGVYDDSPAPPG